jgi:hypothetical protein
MCLRLHIESRFYKSSPCRKFFLAKHYYYHHHHHHLGGNPEIDYLGTESCPLKIDENGEIYGLGNASSVGNKGGSWFDREVIVEGAGPGVIYN